MLLVPSNIRITNAIMPALWVLGYTLRWYNFHFRDFYKIGIRNYVSKVVGTLMKGFSVLEIKTCPVEVSWLKSTWWNF